MDAARAVSAGATIEAAVRATPQMADSLLPLHLHTMISLLQTVVRLLLPLPLLVALLPVVLLWWTRTQPAFQWQLSVWTALFRVAAPTAAVPTVVGIAAITPATTNSNSNSNSSPSFALGVRAVAWVMMTMTMDLARLASWMTRHKKQVRTHARPPVRAQSARENAATRPNHHTRFPPQLTAMGCCGRRRHTTPQLRLLLLRGSKRSSSCGGNRVMVAVRGGGVAAMCLQAKMHGLR